MPQAALASAHSTGADVVIHRGRRPCDFAGKLADYSEQWADTASVWGRVSQFMCQSMDPGYPVSQRCTGQDLLCHQQALESQNFLMLGSRVGGPNQSFWNHITVHFPAFTRLNCKRPLLSKNENIPVLSTLFSAQIQNIVPY